MTAADALKTARDAGIDVSLDGEDLALEAPAPPPADILALLSRHKAGIVAILQPGPDGWSAEDWQAFRLEQAAIAEFDGGLAPIDAEIRAFDCCVAEWLHRNPQYESSARCLVCQHSDRVNDRLLPVGIAGAGEVWLHSSCAREWAVARKSAAVAALAVMGITRPNGQ